MEKLVEKIIEVGIEQFADSSRQELVLSDKDILKDFADEKSLEQRYEKLNLTKEQRMLINDYISCMKTADSRYSDISYIAGIKDTIKMFVYLDLLKGIKMPA